MMTLQSDLETAIAQVVLDSQKLKDIVNGPISGVSSIVTVDSGSVKSVARALVEIGDTSNQATRDLTNVTNQDFTDKVVSAGVRGYDTVGNGLQEDTTTQISVDVGTTANKIIQLNGSAQLPAVNGSLLTGIVVGATSSERTNIMLNAFRIAVQGGMSLQQMVDGFVDEYNDLLGVDEGVSSGLTGSLPAGTHLDLSTATCTNPTGGLAGFSGSGFIDEDIQYGTFTLSGSEVAECIDIDLASAKRICHILLLAQSSSSNHQASTWDIYWSDDALSWTNTDKTLTIENETSYSFSTIFLNAGSHRHWRLKLASNAANGSGGIHGVQMRETSTTPFLGLTADPSNTSGISITGATGSVAGGAITDTYQAIGSGSPYWTGSGSVTFAVPNGTTNVKRMRFWGSDHSSRPYDFNIESSNDGGSSFSNVPITGWDLNVSQVNADDGRCTNADTVHEVSFAPIDCNRIRVNFPNSQAGNGNFSANFFSFFKEDAPFSDMTIVGLAQTALVVPDNAFVTLRQEDVDPITLNADLTAEVSRDGGITWTAITLSEETSLGADRILTGPADISSQPSGTSMVYRIKTLNSKEQVIHATALQWS